MTAKKEMIMPSNKVITSRNEGDIVELTEDDIPGAKLTGAMYGYTMSELKWWLLCRSMKAPHLWNKNHLISRYFKELILYLRGV